MASVARKLQEADRCKEICKIAFSESQRGLAAQESTLTSVRQNATALGTLSGLAATFLGKEALSKQAATWDKWEIWIAISSLITTIALVAFLLQPRNVWKLHFSASAIIDQFVGRPSFTLADTYEKLARFNEDNYKSNDKQLNRMFILLRLLVVALSIQIGAWLYFLSCNL